MMTKENKPDFYLASSEGFGMEAPRKCFRVGQLMSESRDDLLLVNIDPPIDGRDYKAPIGLTNMIVLSVRHKGSSLFPINEWPVYVYVDLVLVDNIEEALTIHDSQRMLIAWAELYRSYEDALAKRF